jgi:protein-S-isoprenylcysteine O-methyltransferase Ste14
MTMTSKSLLLPLSRYDLVDCGIRAALGLTFAFYAGACFKKALAQSEMIDLNAFDVHHFSDALATLAIGLFMLTVSCFYALRIRPIRRTSGFWPWAAAIIGGFLLSALMLLDQRTDLPLAAQAAASMLVLAGNGFAVYVLSHLGRSFSILPESRKLVTTGPYRVVRHPLYLAEAVATLGVLIEFISPWALLIVLTQFALQNVRIHYEEKILRETFPKYKMYSQVTWRLIPMIY